MLGILRDLSFQKLIFLYIKENSNLAQSFHSSSCKGLVGGGDYGPQRACVLRTHVFWRDGSPIWNGNPKNIDFFYNIFIMELSSLFKVTVFHFSFSLILPAIAAKHCIKLDILATSLLYFVQYANFFKIRQKTPIIRQQLPLLAYFEKISILYQGIKKMVKSQTVRSITNLQKVCRVQCIVLRQQQEL